MRTGTASGDADGPRRLHRPDRRAPNEVDLASGAGTKAAMAGRQRVVDGRRRKAATKNTNEDERPQTKRWTQQPLRVAETSGRGRGGRLGSRWWMVKTIRAAQE